MLTIHQIMRIHQEGIELRFSRKKVMKELKGEYDPSEQEMLVYIRNIESLLELDITLLHECIHARDDVRGKRSFLFDNQEDSEVEHEALLTYTKKPEVLAFLKDIYQVKRHYRDLSG